MTRRRAEGDETWARLRDWTKGQKASERLAAHILQIEGYISLDPVHPLGGPDRLKDIICVRDNKQWIGAVYFPKGEKSFLEIKNKFIGDLKGVSSNNVGGIAFITNQEVSLRERNKLIKIGNKSKAEVDLFHLERVARILDNPLCYGIRLEFLDIEMTKEEQLAFIAARDKILEDLRKRIENVVIDYEITKRSKTVPLDEIKEFRDILNSITGRHYLLTQPAFLDIGGHINDLRVPLQEMREFEEILNRIVGNKLIAYSISPTIRDLYVPIDKIKEYEEIVNRIINKLTQVRKLQKSLKKD